MCTGSSHGFATTSHQQRNAQVLQASVCTRRGASLPQRLRGPGEIEIRNQQADNLCWEIVATTAACSLQQFWPS